MLDQKKSHSKDLFIFPGGRAENKFHSYETHRIPQPSWKFETSVFIHTIIHKT